MVIRNFQTSSVSILRGNSTPLEEILDYGLGCAEKLLCVPYDLRIEKTCIDFELDCEYILTEVDHDRVSLMHLIIASVDEFMLHNSDYVPTWNDLFTLEKIIRLLYNYHRSELGQIEISLANNVDIAIINNGIRMFQLSKFGYWYHLGVIKSDTWRNNDTFMNGVLKSGDLDLVSIALNELKEDAPKNDKKD